MTERVFEFERFLHQVQSFHGYAAPGVILGGFMVNLAKSGMPPGVLFDAICETTTCLPDAIQILTPCTIGNGWLKILDFSRYALTLYDKKTGDGLRVYLVPERIYEQPEIRDWFFKLKPKAEQNMKLLMTQIEAAGPTLCGIHLVRVQPEVLKKRHKGEIVVCPWCGEAYRAKDGGVCRACQGESPYVTPARPATLWAG
jgi:formylmethanofuran dehydrogenase subunit E